MTVEQFTTRALWSLTFIATGLPLAVPTTQARGELRLAVTDTVSTVVRQITPNLRLEVRRESDGWEVAVVSSADRRGDNLLYHSREWHGPYPTQVYPWLEATNFFGRAVRVLPVRGYPWVVQLSCEGCVMTGSGTSTQFAAGVLQVRWRREAEPQRVKPRSGA
jgi:hypothetical protein